MAFKLIKTSTVVVPCEIRQLDEAGKTHVGKLRVRAHRKSREEWDALKEVDDDDDRILYDVLVAGFEDEVLGADEKPLDSSAALKLIREDLSVTGQIVDQIMEYQFGAAAKNARRSRAR